MRSAAYAGAAAAVCVGLRDDCTTMMMMLGLYDDDDEGAKSRSDERLNDQRVQVLGLSLVQKYGFSLVLKQKGRRS